MRGVGFGFGSCGLHQANLRIMSAVGDKLGLDKEKVATTIEKYGNTSAASIPITLDDMNQRGVCNLGIVFYWWDWWRVHRALHCCSGAIATLIWYWGVVSELGIVFAGQGSQFVGMGKTLCEAESRKDCFNMANICRP